MTFDFGDMLNILEGDEFEERPVEIEEFVMSEDYLDLGETPLSEYQYQLVRASSQIYKKETLIHLYGEEVGEKRFLETKNEIIFQLGKGCHSPETPVFNPESGNWSRLDSLGEGRVISQDGMSHYATESFIEGQGEMVEVVTALGFKERVYVKHKYLSYSKDKFYRRARGHRAEYKPIDELRPGDRVALAVGFDVDSPVNIPIEHAELVGYWLGDGMLPADHNSVLNMDFCSDEVESIQRYEQLCAYIGDTPTKRVHPTKNLTFFRHGRNSKAVALAKEYGLWGMRSKDKRIPDAVWASDNERISAVVAKLWQTDGCIYAKNGITAEFVSVSEQLAIDVQRMLLRLGVPAGLRFRTPKSNYKNASLAGYVTVTSDECIRAFVDKVNLLDHKKITIPVKNGRVYSRLIDNLYYDRIVSIVPCGEGDYWTRTVPETGNYVGNGLVSANSGKDFTSTIACAYIVYLLLCLKDPARYYGKPPGDSIDIINVAINATQANQVFFSGFKNRINRAPWFQGKYSERRDAFDFDKNIHVYSGHSEREAWEGYNFIYVVLDEIAGFALDSTSGNEQAKTAQAVYEMYSASVDSRFSEFGKLVLLSWPRFRDDFIQQRYNAVVAEKNVTVRSHTFKMDPDLPDGTEGNELTVEWEVDEIISYNEPGIYALKRASWEVNPTKNIDMYIRQFWRNPVDALSRFACMPPEAIDAFFKDTAKIDHAFSGANGVDTEGRFSPMLQPKPDTKYYVHVDLARKIDHCAVSMAHVEKWEQRKIGAKMTEPAPVVKVDAVRWWTPTKDKNVDFADVREYIVNLKRRGFDLGLVTFDRWESHDMMEYLNGLSIPSERLSVAKKHYEDMAMVIAEERLLGPNIELLRKELKRLRIMPNDKIDHPRTGSKDLADATCGAVYNAIAYTPRDLDQEIDVQTLSSFRKVQRNIDEEDKKSKYGQIIEAPKKQMPQELEDFLADWTTI